MASARERKETAPAQWTLIEQLGNDTDVEIPFTVTYIVGCKTVKQEESAVLNSTKHATELKTERNFTLINVSATYEFTRTHNISESHLSRCELSQSLERKFELKVLPGKSIFFWQLVAQYADASIRFPAYHVTDDPTPPATVVSCTVTVQDAQKIDDDTLVRLKHNATGKYLIGIKRKGWEAATLAENRDVYFRIRTCGQYVRICLVKPIYDGYSCAYSSDKGDIYFDKENDNCKQLWEMSIKNPVDGDAVTFRNKKWHGAGLVLHDGPATNVHCLERHNFDLWILEACKPCKV